ncbi:MAG: hypothetical protein C0597_10385 [Marinilabiliales bacterium]|nr:MAG: hypothetical protein C0597_10385 [Marinilabiliales bacterium]
MKLNILKFVGFFVLVAFIASCDQEAFEEYSSVPAGTAPTISVTIDSVTDSAMTVSYSISVPGRISLALIEGVDTPALADLELRTFETSVYAKFDDAAGEETTTFSDLDPYTQYFVAAIGYNTDGVASEMFLTDVTRTLDLAEPVLSGYSPSGQSPRALSNQPIVLTFSEPVVYDNTKGIHFFTYWPGVDVTVPEDSISVSGNTVTISYGILPFNNYCFIEYAEGAFKDLSGNPCEEVVSGVIGGFLEGIWFRTETDPATQLAVIFENFLGSYTCTDFSNSDSTSVDWGPYGVTISEDPDV